jgi:peptidyl-prolyl cis-trans isomerase B (cyclophilin B)
MITLETNLGPITLELDWKNTPLTAANFLEYAKNGFYDNTIFHRVIGNFMVQGGGFDDKMNQKATKANIKNEAKTSEKNKRGTVAMARTSDPHSASSQFFINVVDNDFLNFSSESANGWGYCVFAKVVDGMDIVDQIRKVPTTSRAGHDDVPATPVIIEKVIVSEEAPA